MDSVMLGASETTRRTGTGIRTVRPVSSETIRKDSFRTDEFAACSLCARAACGDTHKSSEIAASPSKQFVARFLKKQPLPRQEPDSVSASVTKIKMPRESRGATAQLPLAKSSANCGTGGWPG